MEHSHQHNRPLSENIGRLFVIGIALNVLFVILEFGAGFITNSLALISDAGHNLSDVFSLSLSLIAFRLSKIKATEIYTYGFKKSTILVSLFNAVILLLAAGSIGWEAIQRFNNPQAISGTVIAVVAGIGIIINVASAFLFFNEKEKDLNVKGAYLHLMADALVSVGVVFSGVIISYTNWMWVDSVISLVIVCVIIFGTWGLLKDSLRLSMDAVPKEIDIDSVKKSALTLDGVIGIHHLHIWASGTTQTAATSHIVVKESLSPKQIATLVKSLKHQWEHLGIAHSTIEVETEEGECADVTMKQ